MRALLFVLAFLAVTGSVAAQQLNVNPTPPSQTGIRQEGPYMTAPVVLDGATLFRIVAPANPLPGQVSIATRQLDIQNVLAQLVAITGIGTHQATVYDPETLIVDVMPSNSEAVLEGHDKKHSTPVSILTVTPTDAKYYGMTITSLAYRWRGILDARLRQALLKRQPGVEEHNERRVWIAGGILVVLTLFCWMVMLAPIQRRIRFIEDRQEQRSAQLAQPNSAPSANVATDRKRRRHFLALALRAKDPDRQLGILEAVAATIVWILVGVWFAALVWALLLFPETTPLAHRVVQTVLAVAAIWIGAGLLNRLLDLTIARVGTVLRSRRFASAEDRAREMLRIPTFTRAISGFKGVILIFVALLITLGEVGIPVWSVVTFGGLTAIGITLAAQNFVRDFVNGFLVLIEDQYVVGDYITIDAQSGIVENLTLRIVQMRDMGGNLITIPHSSVTSVINHSRNWSRVDYRVSIDPSADASKAMNLVRRAIESIAHDEHWHGVVLEPLEWIGVESLSRDGVIIRASMKTAPLRQFELRRAINDRVRVLFSENGIGFGAPVPEAIS